MRDGPYCPRKDTCFPCRTPTTRTGIRRAHLPLHNLDDSRLLAQDGLPPSEGNPHFHQQMVYAVAMSTVQQFERALGRPVFWRPMPDRAPACPGQRLQ
jgi:hypothetical protein